MEVDSSNFRKQIIINFMIFTIGIIFNFSGFIILVNLQSSINIEDGIGTTSLMSTFISAAVFGIFFTPIILSYVGPKTCLILSEITYVVYIAANYYPVAYTIIPAGIIVGIGDAIIWPVMMLYCVYYAGRYAEYGKKERQRYITEFIGIFYGIFQCNKIFGSLLGYAILYGGKSPIPQPNYNTSTSNSSHERDLSICGKNDCQLPNVTNENIDKYIPTSKTVLYILISVLTGMVFVAIIIHYFFIKNIDSCEETSTNLEESLMKSKAENLKEESKMNVAILTIKSTLLHLFNPKQLLITPFALYNGLSMAFMFSETTRAFGSCMLGVEQVGLLIAITAGADAIMSYSSGKLSSRYGRNVVYFIGGSLDVGKYIILLLWVPTESTLWVIYIIFILQGLVDGVWQPMTSEMHGAYFPKNQKVAFSVSNIYSLLGVSWQAGWSTSLCVYEKIYFQISFFIFSTICYTTSQLLFYRKNSTTEVKLELRDSSTNNITT